MQTNGALLYYFLHFGLDMKQSLITYFLIYPFFATCLKENNIGWT